MPESIQRQYQHSENMYYIIVRGFKNAGIAEVLVTGEIPLDDKNLLIAWTCHNYREITGLKVDGITFEAIAETIGFKRIPIQSR